MITGTDVTGLGKEHNLVRFPQCPGKAYLHSAEQDFDHANPQQEQQLLKTLDDADSHVSISAGPFLATSIASVDGAPHVFFANFTGLRGGVNPVQTPQTNIQVMVREQKASLGHFLPFLGEVQDVHGTAANGRVTYTLPPITKGAVFWYDAATVLPR